jgi:predicted HTH transcriptional regulator
MQQQMRRLANKVEREKLLLSAIPELALRIVDHVRDHGRVTIRDAVTLTGASRNTLKEHLRMLVERRHLVQHGVGRGTWYSLP